MARQFGTDSSVFNTLSAPLTDPSGLPIIETSNGFGSSPLGISLREQIQFGLPNASFNLLPPDPAAAISEGENPLPFWELQTTPNIVATTTYDTTTQTWGVKIDPGTAPSGDYATLKTRSWVTTDDNLALRQRASLTLAKNGTYAGTSQWNMTLTAEYFDHANASLGSAVIGTVYDNTTWTSISGTTTTGGSAISSSAAWAEFTIKLTTTQTVSSSTSVTLKSLLVATSTPASGGAFVVTDTFNASGTWARPTGVTTLLAVVGVGGGGGGMGGATRSGTVGAVSGPVAGDGGPSGGSSSWAILREIYVGGTADATITVGIGTAGAGGAGTTYSKAAGNSAQVTNNGSIGGAGGATTFGSYLTIPGGGGGASYAVAGGGTAGGVPTSTVFGLELIGSVAGTFGSGNNGLAGSASAYTKVPYWETFAAGSAGAAGTATGGTLNLSPAGGAAGSAGIIGSGAPGGRVTFDGTSLIGGTAGVGGYGAGSGGSSGGSRITATQTVVATGGRGGDGAPNAGAGGGGGGGAGAAANNTTTYTASTITLTSGAGGNGSAGRIYVVYVA